MISPVIPANPGSGPGQAPESRKNKYFWTPAGVYPERSRRAGVTALVAFCEAVNKTMTT
jgi:hypothetical protein